MERCTKIVATLGPACDSPEAIADLVDAGMDVARLGLAHGSLHEHLARMSWVRAAAAAAGRTVAVLADLPGPKVRAAPFPDDGVFLAEDAVVNLAPGEGASSERRIEVGYADLLADLAPGDQVTLGDGALVLLVVERLTDHLVARVLTPGRVVGSPGVHLPDERVRLSSPTDDDLDLLKTLVPAGVDAVALSFVRRATDVRRVREAITELVPSGSVAPLLVAKIETRSAVDHLDEVLEAADAAMVARGDLGTSCAIEEVPHLQKRIVRRCVEWGQPVITATQMLESMTHSPMPTRAEASDVANAVFDGTDAVMLSGETAIGRHPTLVVRAMVRLVSRAEREADYAAWGARLGRMQRRVPLGQQVAITAATAHAAWMISVELDAAAILCCTRSGLTARAMARFRPRCRLLGLSPNEATTRQLALSWGVEPITVNQYTTTDEMVWCAVEAAVAGGHLAHGDIAVVVAGAPEDESPTSDVVRVVRVR